MGGKKNRKKRKLYRKWTIDTALQEAKKYITLTDFSKHATGAYQFLQRRHILDKCGFERLHNSKEYYTKEKCFEITHNCTTRSDVKRKYPRIHDIICNNNWFPEMTWIKPPKNNHVDGYYIYSYEFPDECIYFGTTINPTRRHKQHMGIVKSDSAVYEHHIKTGLPVPEMKIILRNLSAEDAIKKENEYVEKAQMERGVDKVLNRAKPGSLGSGIRKWTESSIKREINHKGYKRWAEFRRGAPGAYRKAIQYGLCASDLGLTSNTNNTKKTIYVFQADGGALVGRYESIHEASKTLNISRGDINLYFQGRVQRVGDYVFAFDKTCPALPQTHKHGHWNFENCRKTGIEDGSRTAFARNHPGGYEAARVNDWLDLIFEEKFRPILQIDQKTGETVNIYECRYIARKAGFTDVYYSLKHGTPCKGYIFRYAS